MGFFSRAKIWAQRRGAQGGGGVWGDFSATSRRHRVKLRRLWGRRGFTRQPQNSKRAHFRDPALQTPPKFHERTPKREKKERKLWRDREKKREIFGPPTLRSPTLRGPTPRGATLRVPTLRGPPFGSPPFPGLGSHPSGPHPSGPHPSGPHPSVPPPLHELCLPTTEDGRWGGGGGGDFGPSRTNLYEIFLA